MNHTISFLRNFAIFAIVLHHSISAFLGWPPNHAIGGDVAPWALNASAFGKTAGLGVFTFISGFVLFYQSGKSDSLWRFVVKKCKRIIVPCLFWACVYGLFFSTFMYYDWWPAAINGTHLWYLPMLFLCIMVASSHFYLRHPFVWICGFCLVVALIAKLTHFRTLTEFCFYFPIFYSGYWLNRLDFRSIILKHKRIMMTFAMGGVILWFTGCVDLGKLTMAFNMFLSSISLYVIFVLIFNNVNRIGKFAYSLSKQSFSIYLMHQFCINILLEVVSFASMNFNLALSILFLVSFVMPWLLAEFYDKISVKFNIYRNVR